MLSKGIQDDGKSPAANAPASGVDVPRADGGEDAPCWPWAPLLTVDDVRRMRVALVQTIETLAEFEGWPRELLDDVLAHAVRGPLSALLPDLNHFAERLAEARTERAARIALKRRTWRLQGLDDRRGKYR
ncbi:hypothetical protein [Paraburkholderia silvatlantica]|uniref:Uncharacterized protein n=1 Tax=Paraburkholderia silvatlantica TaxID=321895 RepID=A0ABR6FRU1_9BURK|nr:hypothetical protein [Paraburkholderia silvatlantica]MBB2930142.1 hypothetical protein [Paraburkholderia silvatlantica]PVY22483.1 hypothetical protein C7411_13183 [Paraburkholderia silvatlantica]PXW28952.1 hypothetical protein C7413_13183 [Paraburkholderia silvatlantica]